jgi:hypothetical protein
MERNINLSKDEDDNVSQTSKKSRFSGEKYSNWELNQLKY